MSVKNIIFPVLITFFSSIAIAEDREIAIINTASSAAEWIHFSGASSAAEWIHFSGPSPAATNVFITDDCSRSPIKLLDSSPTYAEWVYISGASSAADWIFLSGASSAADWYHITEKESTAEITLCIPNIEKRTEQNIAILLHLLKKGK